MNTWQLAKDVTHSSDYIVYLQFNLFEFFYSIYSLTLLDNTYTSLHKVYPYSKLCEPHTGTHIQLIYWN